MRNSFKMADKTFLLGEKTSLQGAGEGGSSSVHEESHLFLGDVYIQLKAVFKIKGLKVKP